MLPNLYSHGLGGEAANSAVAMMWQQIKTMPLGLIREGLPGW